MPPSATSQEIAPPSTATPSANRGVGAGFGILVNANAKRGGRRVAVQIGRVLTGANVRLTKRASEIDAWLRAIPSMRCLLAAGGDGSAIALVNALDRVVPKDAPLPPIGVIPLGTGNAWAHVTGARKLHIALDELARARDPLPLREFGLVECEGVLSHFAGSGWDAQVIEDYRAQVASAKGPSARLAKTVYGYVAAMLVRTAPKTLLLGRPHVIVENLGDEVYSITADRKLVKIEGARHGSVLYDGLASVAGVATCPEFGYRFRAYPFAERLLGHLNARVYCQSTPAAIRDIPKLWRGEHPLEGMHDWFSTHIRMTFSRPVPLQIGGDAMGMRTTIEYKISDRKVALLDWRRLA
ncbi:MAG: diacylglycerol kinase family protein [Polyangiaceae bacterium]